MPHPLYILPLPRDRADLTQRAGRILRETLTAADLPLDDLAPRVIPTDQALNALEREPVALVTPDNPPTGHNADIIAAAIKNGARIEPIPGAADAITALVLSGFPTDNFVAYANDQNLPDTLASDTFTVVIGVRDLAVSLPPLIDRFGADRLACVLLDSAGWDVYRGALGAAPAAAQPAQIVLMGAEPTDDTWDEARVIAALRTRLQAGASVKDAAKAVAAASGWSRSDLYTLALQLRGE